MIVYTCALKYWAEKSDLPTGGQPCQLVKSVKELWEKMSCYLSFLDKEVFKGITPPEGMPTNLVEEAKAHSLMAIPATTSKEQAAKGPLRKQPRRGSAQNSLDGKKCYTHPSMWWLLGSPLACQEAWSRLIHLWPTSVCL